MKTNKNAQKDFQARVEGISYMTPTIIGYDWIYPNKISYELAKGEGLEGEVLYGVTTSRFAVSLSMAWLSLEQAEIYIKYLKTRVSRRILNAKASKAK